MKLQIDHSPEALILQIDPNGNKLVEATVRCEIAIEGTPHGIRDVWLKDMPMKLRKQLQACIDDSLEEAKLNG